MKTRLWTHTAFGKTRLCKISCHNFDPSEDPDEILWVERVEDMYALMYYDREKPSTKVGILRREDWLRAGEYES